MKRPLCLLCMAFVGLLVICVQLMPMPVPDHYELDGQYLILEGEVYRKEYRTGQKGSNILVIYLEANHFVNQKCSEQSPNNQIQNVMCYMKENNRTVPVLGSTVRMKGKVKCFAAAGNPGEFDMRGYYRIMKLDFSLEDACIMAMDGKEDFLQERLYRLKQYFAGVLDNIYDEKEASVMKAMLLGEKNGLDEETKSLYRRNSIIHILSISGLHISMIGMGIYRFLRRLTIPLKSCAVLSIAVICGYGIMTGMSMSAVRAVFMFVMHLAADMAGRTYDMMTALSVAAVLLLVEQPRYVEHSGFLFSFGAVAAIGVLVPVLYEKKKITGGTEAGGKIFGRIRDKTGQAFASGIAVTLATLPVHLAFYYQFPVYSIILNIIVIPLMAAAMGAGLFCMLTGGIVSAPAMLVSNIDRVILWFYEICCKACEMIPGGTFIGGIPAKWQVCLYIAMIAMLAAPSKIWSRCRGTLGKIVWITAALCILVYRPTGKLAVTMVDVGQGDCIHIQAGDGSNYLIDGGSSSKGKVAEYQIIPYLKARGVSRLEAVFITHSDSDHCSGIISMLEEYPGEGVGIENLILPNIGEGSRDGQYRELLSLAEEKGIGIRYMSRGEYLERGKMRITCMHPSAGYNAENGNEYSLVLYLEYGAFTGLFTGDAEGDGESMAWRYTKKYLDTKNTGRLTVLKVAHHGSGNSTEEEMLKELLPRLALISCGKNNRYGHPHAELLERLERVGSRIYLTPENGAVTVKSNGKRMWVETFR